MWTPDYLKVKNLQSHSDSTFAFVRGRVVMIKGVNQYDDKPKSNGAGKSVFIEGLSLAYTGDPIRKVTVPELIKNGMPQADIEFSMTNSATRQTMVIERTLFRSKSKPSKLSITIGGAPVDFAHIADGDKYILDTIGISKVDLFNYYIISKKKYVSFFYSTDAKKRDLIARFSKADRISGVFDEIKADADIYEEELLRLDAELSNLEGRKSAYEEQLADDGSAAKQRTIDRLTEGIASKNKAIEEVGSEIKGLISKMDEAVNGEITAKKLYNEATENVDNIKSVDYSDARNEIAAKIKAEKDKASPYEADKKSLTSVVAELTSYISGFNKDIAKIDTQLAGIIECPKCEHEFVATNTDISKEKLESAKKDLENQIAEAEADRNEAEGMIDAVGVDLGKIDEVIAELNKETREVDELETRQVNHKNALLRTQSMAKRHLDEVSNSITSIEARMMSKGESVEGMEKSILELETEIEEVKNRKDDKSAIKERIELAEKSIEEVGVSIIEKKSQLSSVNTWVEIFKRFNIKLSNMAVKSIEGLSNDILRQMNSNLTLEIEGYKVNQKGTVSDVITANVLRYGVLEGSFFKFSEGEQAMMNMSAVLAMQQLINMGCPSGGLDMMFVDEITESMDSAVIKELVQALDTLGRTIAIITHVSDEEVMIDNELTIIKDKDGSRCQ